MHFCYLIYLLYPAYWFSVFAFACHSRAVSTRGYDVKQKTLKYVVLLPWLTRGT